ncbi:MAG: hypothetical protein Q4C87_10650 [Actinomycetaceae bacterium]|nr:hypothetical protein [Actinomycetaceae bacterium]
MNSERRSGGQSPTRHTRQHAAPTPPPDFLGPEDNGRTSTGFFLPLSALAVLTLAALIAVVSFLPGARWSSAVIVSVAICGLSAGWPRLTNATISFVARLCIALTGIATAFAVAFSRDFRSGVMAFGLGVILILGVQIFMSPHLKNYSTMDRVPIGPPDDPASADEANSYVPAWGQNSTSASAAASIAAIAIACGGTSWVALAANEETRVLVPISAVAVAGIVAGRHVGSTFWIRSTVAMLAAGLAGLLTAWGLWSIGLSAAFPPLLQSLANSSRSTLTPSLVLGLGSALSMGIVVIAISALFGEVTRSSSLWERLSRAALKFLVAVIPVYLIVRLGGF